MEEYLIDTKPTIDIKIVQNICVVQYKKIYNMKLEFRIENLIFKFKFKIFIDQFIH